MSQPFSSDLKKKLMLTSILFSIFTIFKSFLIEYSMNSGIESDKLAVELIVIGISALIIKVFLLPLVWQLQK